MIPDLNCDLGEGEAPSRTRSLMRGVTSANVACGGHAGDLRSMQRCVRWAAQYGVRLGAHPGTADRQNFGRTATALTPDELELLLLQQVGVLERIARGEGVRLHHIKLHGALYHATERDARLARRYLEAVERHWPGVVVYALACGRVAAMAGIVTVWEEAFLDRRYRPDGSLVPRGEHGAVLEDLPEALAQAKLLIERGEVETNDGRVLRLQARTLCVHSDSPGAPRLAGRVRKMIR